MTRKRGFTLIELITVIAITTILLTIIMVPVIQGFNLTRAAQAFADAQDRARTLMRQMERELGNGAAVRDNTGLRGAIVVVVPGQIVTPKQTWEAVTLFGTKLDVFKPAEGDPTRGPSGAFINPNTGKEDPSMQAPKGQMNLPTAAGLSMVRYFIGLRAPVVADANGVPLGPGKYNNPYDNLMMKRNGDQDNLYVLYRAEVQVKVWDKVNSRYIVNPDLFLDANNDGEADDIDDPSFFALVPLVDYDYQTNGFLAGGLQKAVRIQNWLRKSRVVTEVSRYDMIAPVYDRTSRKVFYQANAPQLVPLVRFQPTRITNEPATGEKVVRNGEEGPNMGKIGSDAFTTKFGSWSDVFMRLFPSAMPDSYSKTTGRAGDIRARWGTTSDPTPPYLVARAWSQGGTSDNISVFMFEPDTMTDDVNEGMEIFDIKQYLSEKALPKPDVNAPNYNYPYAFSDALRNLWITQHPRPDDLQYFLPFYVDSRGGKVITSFDAREWGVDRTIPYEYRVPTLGQETTNGLPIDLRSGVRVSPYDANQALDYTPNNDPDVATGNFFDNKFTPINRRFNKLWNDFPTLAPGLDRSQYVKRYIDLRLCLLPDGSIGPLDITGQQLLLPTPSSSVPRAFITPGSEVIVGPDQRPGPNYGKYVRYQRVTQRPVGANQYLINYVDQPEPTYEDLGLNLSGTTGNLYDPLNNNPGNVIQGVIQPQYRAGYVELNSKFGEPIPSGYKDLNGFHPTGNIFVNYRFQYNESQDVLAVDYDSTQVMELSLTIRNYPQTQDIPNPQSITVKGSAEVRNFIR